MKKYYLWLLCLLFLHPDAYTQQLQWTRYNDVEGYPPYSCRYMLQDRHGWMWFSAGYEILQYNGRRFKNYPPAKGVDLDFAFDLFEVGDEIWIDAIPYMLKVVGDSLQRLDIKNNLLPQIVRSDNIADILNFRDRYFFLCNNGLYTLQNRALKPLITDDRINLTGYEELYAFNDSIMVGYDLTKKKLIVFQLNKKSFYYGAHDVSGLMKRDGRIYFSKPGEGIFQIAHIKFLNDSVDINPELIIPLRQNGSLKFFNKDAGGNFWLFFRDGSAIMVNPDGEWKAISEMDGLKGLTYLNSFLDRENNLWLSARSTLVKVSIPPWDRVTKSDGLLSNSVERIDHGIIEGSLWIKTDLGTNILERNSIRTVLKDNKPFKGTAIGVFGNRIFYFSHNQLCSAEYFPSTYEISHEKMLAEFPTPVITSVLDKKGNVYVASHVGLYVYTHGRREKFNDKIYKTLFIDSRGRLWAGQFNSGLDCFLISYHDNLPRVNLLLMTDSIAKDSPEIQAIRAIAEAPGGRFIIGTRYNGLFVLTMRNNKLIKTQYFNKTKGLASNNVWDISIDNNGTCWIATSGGVNSLSYRNGQWRLKNESKRRKIRETRTIFATAGNHILVNSFPGLISFDPYQPTSVFPFSIAITDVQVNGEKSLPEKMKKLKANENNINISFSANTYRLEDEVTYTWRLREKEEWSELSNSHTIHFSALEPGKYHFMVRAKDAYGKWSKNHAEFHFAILPPFWQQTWFSILIAILMASILYFIYQYRIRQLKKVENLRDHIARDLHDEIGSTLTSINILSKVSRLNLKTDNEKSDELLQTVIKQSEEMQQNMSDIVWAIKPGNDRMENMVAHMREYLAETLEPADIAIHFSVDEHLMRQTLMMKERRDFFLIFKEAVSNVARHSEAGQVHITLRLVKDWIQLTTCDDGKGLCPGKLSTGNGLQNMKERAASLRGKLEIYNGKDGGCCIELNIPLG